MSLECHRLTPSFFNFNMEKPSRLRALKALTCDIIRFMLSVLKGMELIYLERFFVQYVLMGDELMTGHYGTFSCHVIK